MDDLSQFIVAIDALQYPPTRSEALTNAHLLSKRKSTGEFRGGDEGMRDEGKRGSKEMKIEGLDATPTTRLSENPEIYFYTSAVGSGLDQMKGEKYRENTTLSFFVFRLNPVFSALD